MNFLKKILLMVIFSMALFCFSCSEEEGPYGKKIEQDLTNTNIINDNYRNYYEIFVGAFRDSNGDGKGDLQGVIDKLDYIKDMGFNGIWLMPINKSGSYHKYDINDYYQIDPSYGDMSDLENLISECHKRDIKIIMDMVLNHSGYFNPWFSKAKSAYEKASKGQQLTEEENKFKDFYTFYADKKDIPTAKKCYEVSGKGYYYEGNFTSEMPEFNCDSEAVRAEFKNIFKFYLDKGIDGFRLDAVKYFYIESTSKNVEFLSLINKWVKEINPSAYIVGECWDSDTVIEQYYQSGCDSFFNFSASVSNPSSFIINSLNLEGKMLNRYYDGMVKNVEMANGHIPAPFIDNHDMPRFTTVSEDIAKFKYALLSMLNGSTFTYYGDEVGMVGSNPPDQNVRIPMKWGEKDEVGDCKPVSGVTKAEYPYGTVAQQIADEDSLYNFYKKCLLIRNQNPEIARGNITLVKKEREESKLLFIKKSYNDSEIGIIFNFSPTLDLEVDFKAEGFSKVVGQIVVDNKTYIGLKNDKIFLPPYSIAIVK